MPHFGLISYTRHLVVISLLFVLGLQLKIC